MKEAFQMQLNLSYLNFLSKKRYLLLWGGIILHACIYCTSLASAMDKLREGGSHSFSHSVASSTSFNESSFPRKTVRILTIDGGGLSSIIPVTILEKIEEHLQAEYPHQQIHLAEYFDIMAATSTSSILVLGLSARLSAESIAKLYLKNLHKLFCTSSSLKVQPLYDAQALESTLQDFFGNKWLKEAAGHILIPADNLGQKCAYLFDSHSARHPSCNFRIRDVARAACTRLSDFSPATIKDEKGLDTHTFADGEQYAYDPTFEAIKVAEREHPGCDLFIVSLGTGEAPRRFGDLILTQGDTIPLSQSSQGIMRHQKDRHLGYLGCIKKVFKQQERKVKYIRLQVPVDSSLTHVSTLDSIKSFRQAGLSFTNNQHKKYKKFEKILNILKSWTNLDQVPKQLVGADSPLQEIKSSPSLWELAATTIPFNNQPEEVKNFQGSFPERSLQAPRTQRGINSNMPHGERLLPRRQKIVEENLVECERVPFSSQKIGKEPLPFPKKEKNWAQPSTQKTTEGEGSYSPEKKSQWTYVNIDRRVRDFLKPLGSVVDSFTPQQDAVTAGMGPVPVTITINNLTNFDLEFSGYNISSGKVVKEHKAPETIKAHEIATFTASARKFLGIKRGPEGTVKYAASSKSFEVIFYWKNPIETGGQVDGEVTLSGANITCQLTKKTEPGMHGRSSLKFTLQQASLS
jgi:patatin-like phospholipase/acyl hydrolase